MQSGEAIKMGFVGIFFQMGFSPLPYFGKGWVPTGKAKTPFWGLSLWENLYAFQDVV